MPLSRGITQGKNYGPPREAGRERGPPRLQSHDAVIPSHSNRVIVRPTRRVHQCSILHLHRPPHPSIIHPSIHPSSITTLQPPLRSIQPHLRIRQLLLQRLDIINRHLHRARLTITLLGRRPRRDATATATTTTAVATTPAARPLPPAIRPAADTGRGRGKEPCNLLKGVVDAIATALFGDLVGGALGGEVGGEGFGVGDAGEVGAFEDVLVVGFRGQEEGRGFGVYGCFLGVSIS